MARGVNKVILIGNLGGDPEVRYTPSGSAIANISLATSESWRDKQTGELQERTEWHRVVFFNRLAEIVGEFLHKGSKCYVEGSLRTRKWVDKSGLDRYTTEIIANEMSLLDSRTSSGYNTSNEKFTPKPAAQQATAASPETLMTTEVAEPSVSPEVATGMKTDSANIGDNSDDVPF